MVCCCCCLCCPVHRCAFLICAFEIFFSCIVWYNALDFIAKTHSVLQLKDVLTLLFITGWLITLFTATFTLVLAHKKKRSEFVLPRLIQQTGLLIIGFIIAFIIIFYFSGGSTSINNLVISIYENLMLEVPLSKDDRREAYEALRYCFILLILLDFIFICYMAFCLSTTQKFYKKLKSMEYHQTPQTVSTTGYGPSAKKPNTYTPISQTPSAPPPYNPHYNTLPPI